MSLTMIATWAIVILGFWVRDDYGMCLALRLVLVHAHGNAIFEPVSYTHLTLPTILLV